MNAFAQKLRWKYGIKLPPWDQVGAVLIMLAIIAFAALLATSAGCQAGSRGEKRGTLDAQTVIKAKTNSDGTFDVEATHNGKKVLNAKGSSTAPEGAKEPSTVNIDDDTTAASSGAMYAPLSPTAVAKATPIFVISAVVFLAAGIICLVWLKFPGSNGMGWGFIAASAGLGGAPFVLEKLAGPLAWGLLVLIGIAIVGAAAWGISALIRHRKNQEIAKVTVPLVKAGLGQQAAEYRSEQDPAYAAEMAKTKPTEPIAIMAKVGEIRPAGGGK